jgi:hypothetical protein
VDLDFANDRYVVCVDTSDNGNCDAGEQVVKNVKMPGGIDLVYVDLGNFQFDRRGFPTDPANTPQSGSITVSNGSEIQRIEMTIAGSCTITYP